MSDYESRDVAPRLLPGRSAKYWMRIAVGSMGAAITIVVVIALVGSALQQPVRGAVTGLLLVIGIVVTVAAFAAALASLATSRRERAAGYTTLYGEKRDLWQLDPTTGAVLRRPGERDTRRRGPTK